jgi:L-ascorbate metabolism protein UlaG (beta-lactamase superfamily)
VNIHRTLLAATWFALSAACMKSPPAQAGATAQGAVPAANASSLAVAPPASAGKGVLRLEWRGGPTAILDKGGHRLITDPMLSPRGPAAFVLPKHPSTGALNAEVARYTDPPATALGSLSLIILSHDHNDHFDREARKLLPKETLFVLPPNAVEAARAAGFQNLRPLDWDQETLIEGPESRLRIVAVPAHHSHDPAIAAAVGKGNGYVLQWDTVPPYTVYWTGDAVLTDVATAVARRFSPIDLWLPHLGGVGGDSPLGLRTMNADEAVRGIQILRPHLTVPIHHTTFGHYREPIAALEQRAQALGLSGLRVPREGEIEAIAH